MIGPGVIVSRIDYKGRRYIGPLVARRNSAHGRGFVLWGNSKDEYAPDGIFRVCAWPDNRRGSMHGWSTLREAQAFARLINDGLDSGYRCNPFREHGLWQCRGFDAFGRHFNRAFSTLRNANLFLSAMRKGDSRVARY